MTEEAAKSKRLHPFCKACGWRKGGTDSWDGKACKCGHSEPPIEVGWIIDGEVYTDRVEADRAYRKRADRL